MHSTSSAPEIGGKLLSQCFGNLEDPKTRRRIYAWTSIFLYIVALGLMTVKARYGHNDRKFDFAASDGKFYYAYDASLFVRHTLDPQIVFDHWGYADKDSVRDAFGRLNNQYPIGVSLTILPSFALAHVTSIAAYAITKNPHVAPDGYSLLYQLFNLAWLFYLAWATFVMLDSLMARYLNVKGTAITLAVLFGWIGTQYVYHQLRFPLMSVVTAPFWGTALVYLAAAAVEKMERSRTISLHWVGMVFCFAMAVVCRNTNVMLITFFVYPFFVMFRSGLFRQFLRKTPLFLMACIPVILQMCVWKYQYNHFVANSYGTGAQFYWSHPAFWQIMFSQRAGLLVWVPVWTIGTIALIAFGRDANRSWWMVCSYLASFAIIWFVNSAYWAWPFSNYPNRGFLELIGLPILGLGLLLQRSQKSSGQRQLVLGVLVASTLVTLALSFAYDARKVRRYGDEVNAMGPFGAWRAR